MTNRVSIVMAAIGMTILLGCKKRDGSEASVKSNDDPAQFVTVSLDSSGAIVGGESAGSVGSPKLLAVFADQGTRFNIKDFYPDVKSVRAVHGSVDDSFNYRSGALGVFDDRDCRIDNTNEKLAGIDCLKVERDSGDASYVMLNLTAATATLNLSDDAYDHHLVVKMYAEAFGGAGNGGDLVMGPTVDRESDCRFGVGISGGLGAQVYGICSYTWQSSRSTAFSSVTFTKMGVQASIFDIPALPLYAVMISTDEGNRVRGPFNCGSIIGAMAFGSAMTASTTWDCNETTANRAVKTILWNEFL